MDDLVGSTRIGPSPAVSKLVAHALAELLGAEPAPVRPSSIGVVFVHGIGSQGQSSTLREFAAPLLDYLHEWHRTRTIPEWQPASADLSYGGTLKGPARVSLTWPSYTRGEKTWPERRFIFAEAWWAARLEAPSFEYMLAWSWRTLWGVVGTLRRQMRYRIDFLRQGGGSSQSDPGTGAAVVEIVSAVGFTAAYFAAAIAGYVVLIPLFVLARIPMKEVQEFILVKALKPFLVENIGDFATYVHDEVQALNVRGAVGDTIRSLITSGCDQICVLAHSQGALVAFDALCALGRDDPTAAAYVRKLITFGGALNRGFAQPDCPPRLRDTLPAHIFWLDIWSQYDPVAGGYLRRPAGYPHLVNPSRDFRRSMGWDSDRDRRLGGPLPDQVVNGMNPLVDHGGYFHNPEQFSNRVLAEIEDPGAYYKRSRFFFDDFERVRRRRTRISVLAFWRLIAIAGLGVAWLLRGISRLSADGHALTEQLVTLPGHELLTAPGKFFDGIGAVLDAIGTGLAGVGFVAGLVNGLRDWWSRIAWSDLLLSSLAFAAAYAALYLVLLWALYGRWDAREQREAIAETLPGGRWRDALIALRSAGVIGAFADAVLASFV